MGKSRTIRTEPTKGRTGRPPAYTRAIADRVIELLEKGVGLATMCRDYKDLPHHTTIIDWVVNDVDGFSSRYAKARDIGIDLLAEEIIRISDDERGDPMRDRLRIDSRKWYCGKIARKRYGENMSHEITGEDGKPIQQQIIIKVEGV